MIFTRWTKISKITDFDQEFRDWTDLRGIPSKNPSQNQEAVIKNRSPEVRNKRELIKNASWSERPQKLVKNQRTDPPGTKRARAPAPPQVPHAVLGGGGPGGRRGCSREARARGGRVPWRRGRWGRASHPPPRHPLTPARRPRPVASAPPLRAHSCRRSPPQAEEAVEEPGAPRPGRGSMPSMPTASDATARDSANTCANSLDRSVLPVSSRDFGARLDDCGRRGGAFAAKVVGWET
jgi:hypothetical protein